MNYLLDTHTFLWFIHGDNELSSHGRKIIENPDTSKFLSIVSFWEIAIKISIGKLHMDFPFALLEQLALENGFEILPITIQHNNQIIDLPAHHKDPFDRIIIAQAICDNLTIIGKDPELKKYEVEVCW
ncbi:type II toxin-antitoxin system VapC family toxin [Dyadobacter psychrotolerans]|uniref:Type II toxin-antitoxin system VapC family toxin n=1 Tax=Dyadobacter psychrotolerans TaxID=2541721 RepID=A0A4R5E2T9_9BACT|nr:type II toxin-antitoxin system VapC family toxin [Dyadobacter psychrotolerans]TDE18553.1 type II toxin-antitoxin system VapC family toxin [Dyadobacter psychrotolerans]